MNAPLYNKLCALAQSDTLRMHMPGHKGKTMPAPFPAAIDYTEIPPTGNLYTGEGPIAQAEELAVQTWGADHAFFLTGGSTQGVMAGLALCAAPGEKILLDRNAHKSFFSAVALLDLDPVYLRAPDAALVAEALRADPEIRVVCVTSPTYYGVIYDLAAIAGICGQYGVRLLVDEAHGAHFPFVGCGPCAVGLGADVCVCSAHKTLPALGSSALLFTGAAFSAAAVREKTALFGTSSPSYPIMASIDWARAWLEEAGGKENYHRSADAAATLRREINARGVFHALSGEDGLTLDPTRLTVMTACAGLDGRQAGKLLEERYHIWPEMDNRDCVVFILTCCDTEEDLRRLADALRALEANAPGVPLAAVAAPPEPEICCSVRRAVFAHHRFVPLRAAEDCVSAACIAPYPPGVPVVAPGERISRAILTYLAETGYDCDAPVSVIAEGV